MVTAAPRQRLGMKYSMFLFESQSPHELAVNVGRSFLAAARHKGSTRHNSTAS